MVSTESFTPPTPPVGVIESLTRGFDTVTRHLILLLIPVLFDLFIWMGPRLTYAPLMDQLRHQHFEHLEASASTSSESLTPELEEVRIFLIDQFASQIGAEEERYLPQPVLTFVPLIIDSTVPEVFFTGLSSLLAKNKLPTMPLIGVPTLLATETAHPLPFGYTPPVREVNSLWDLIGFQIGAGLMGAIGGGVYLMMIASVVRYDGIHWRQLLKRFPAAMGQLTLFGLFAPILISLLLMPLWIIQVGLMLAGTAGQMSEVTNLSIITTQWLITLWLGMFGLFTVHSLLLHERHLLSAMWDSVRVIQWNMTPTLLLMIPILIIYQILSDGWATIGSASWVTLAGIILHAFISTGFITAMYVFYQDRYRHWKEMREVLLAELARRQAEQQQQQA